jgi:hypothetical protein
VVVAAVVWKLVFGAFPRSELFCPFEELFSPELLSTVSQLLSPELLGAFEELFLAA